MNLKDLVFSACGLSDAHRPIRLRLSCANNVLNDQLLVQRVIGSESLCGGLEYRLLCLSTNAYLPLKQFIAQPVELQFVTDTGGLRSVCGIVAQACAGQSDGGLASYQLLVRDALALMDRRSNTRVFRNRNEIDIVQIILDEWRRTNPILAQAFDVDYSKVKASYPAREFTLQHNESDADFLRRLCKRRGIAWFVHPSTGSHPHSTPAHTLVLFDRADLLKKNAAGTVRYHGDSATEPRDSITSWTPVRSLQPGSIARQSWDYMSRPMGSELSSRIDQGEAGNRFAASLEDYFIDTPHAGDSINDYSRLGELRILRHELESKCFYGEGTVRDLCVGQWNGLQGHPEIDTHPIEEREFIITELQVQAQNNLPQVINEQVQRLFASNRWQAAPYLDDIPINSKTSLRYHNRFACVRRTVPLVPAFDARVDLPRPQLQSATVVGPPGEEVHCDAYGRVKVQIHGLRSANQPQQQEACAMDSAWVRVCSTWAGNQWGAIALPRVGDEVIIDFLGGDPDKPIIIAGVFGANALPPTFSHTGQLPSNKYLAGIKSKEVQGSRYNQLRFDDTPEQINAQLASEHCHSQLNLGWLTHPRHNGQGQARGEGAELRSDGAVVMRAAKLMLLTTQAMLQAQGEQLERGPLQTLLDNSHSLLKALGEYAQQHAGLPIEQEAHQNINRALKNAEQGSEPQDSAALIASYAAGGFASATPYSSVSYSGQHHHLIAQQHSQILAGGRLSLQAAQGIAQFAQNNGIQHIAHHGKFDIQAQHDSIGIAAENDVKITANQGEVIVAAQKSITLICGGAYIKIGDGKIEHGCTGPFTVKAGVHSWEGPASASQEMQKFSEGKIDFNDFFQVKDSAGALLANKKYAIERADGSILRGSTDAQGRIELQKSLLTEAIQIKLQGDDV